VISPMSPMSASSSGSRADTVDISQLRAILGKLQGARDTSRETAALLEEAEAVSSAAQVALSEGSIADFDSAFSLTAEINAQIKRLESLLSSGSGAAASSSSSSECPSPATPQLALEALPEFLEEAQYVKNAANARVLLGQFYEYRSAVEGLRRRMSERQKTRITEGLKQLDEAEEHLLEFIRAELIAEVAGAIKTCEGALGKPADVKVALEMHNIAATLHTKTKLELGSSFGKDLIAALTNLNEMIRKLQVYITTSSSQQTDTH